ncbi:MAG: hypothetical protein KAI66_15805 [Lentisphaeria bacterium]|nr:hypothetical protein [Lentisphaeria bacterium]
MKRHCAPQTTTLTLLACLLAVCCGLRTEVLTAAEILHHDRGFTIRTARLSATIRDGIIVGVRNLQTGEVHADSATGDTGVPSGMGHLADDAETAAKLHGPWGTRTMDQHIKAGTSYPTMHRPHAGSDYQTARIPDGVHAVWTGLGNGTKLFPDEALALVVRVDSATGALLFQATASSPASGVYGVQVPIANLHGDHRFYVPSFGGVMYDREMKPGLTTLGGTPFWEAPVIGVEGRLGSLALWVEDEQFHPNFFFFNWSGKTFSLAIEHLNLMPFEPHRQTRSVTWRLDVFPGGWVDAMTPYRNWYARTFESERKARAATKWADKIRIIIDHWDKNDPAVLRRISTVFDPETILYHEWNARAAGFDHDLPDWTPRAGYVERVKAIQRWGSRTMAYVNTYCVNYNSSVFQRDRIETFGLTRKIRSFSGYAREPQQFNTCKDGQLLYLDPLSPQWRKYHTDMMISWFRETGTDANYEDVGGCSGDFGNGVVDGKSGAQGSVEQFRELLGRNPTVPMASEYAPDAIAFAVRWPLRFQQVWGSNRTRVFWMRHQRPVSAFIHGPLQRPWIPVIRAESNFLRHVVVACSDALGGIAQYPATAVSLQANTGILVHMRWRAQLFSRKLLTPHFPAGRQEDPTLACMYRDRDGGIYKYFTDEKAQRMVGPTGRELYNRVTGVNRLATDLNLPGWPAVADGHVLGLDPEIRYALVPGVPDRTPVQVTALPEGVRISRFYSTKKACVLVLERVGAEVPERGVVRIRTHSKFGAMLVNDAPGVLPQRPEGGKGPAERDYDVAFPASFVFVPMLPRTTKTGAYFGTGHEKARYILAASGLDRGGEYVPPHKPAFKVPGESKNVPFTFLNNGGDAEIALDYLVKVPDKDATLRIYVQNRQKKYGNGAIARVYINGRARHEFDLGPHKNPDWKKGMPKNQKNLWDTSFHAWSLPLGTRSGQIVLVTIATDGKASNNADSIWWSRPKFIADPKQKEAFVKLTGTGPVPEAAGTAP